MRTCSPRSALTGLLVGAFSLAGCGPFSYIIHVPAGAAGDISAAKQVQADKYAPYEMTAAEEYIHKARMLAGYARFQSSVNFAKKAEENARKAKQIALDKAALPGSTSGALPGSASPAQLAAAPSSNAERPSR